MPHVTIEYSSNLADRTDIDALVDGVHQTMIDSGAVPADGLRTRAVRADTYRVGNDGHLDNAFIAVFMRLAEGRAPEVRAALIDAVADTVEAALGDAKDRVLLSVEYIEIPADLRTNRNFLRARLGG
jgi:5-carboxymethyl-2-hydroxymuconate isomerase